MCARTAGRPAARFKGVICTEMIRYFFLLSIFLPSVSFAKCISETHTVLGSITNKNLPVSNADITVSYIDGMKRKLDKTESSDSQGNYKIEFRYSTYSGSYIFGPEKCKFTLDQLQLEIEVDGEKDNFQETIVVSGNETTYNKAFNAMDAANRGAH